MSASAAAYGLADSTLTLSIVICLDPVPISSVIGVISIPSLSKESPFRPNDFSPIRKAAIMLSLARPRTSIP